jgi:hypothetical protein
MTIKKNIIVRQVIGRTLLDAGKSNYAFELMKLADGWHVTIHGIEPSHAEQVLELINDCNLFYTEHDDQQLIRKWWLYHQQVPPVNYDADALELTIMLDSMVSYTND